MVNLKEEIKIDSAEVSKKLETFIQKKVSELARNGIIIGLSGGLDSAVVAYLCVRAVGHKKVLAVVMPEKETAPRTIIDAKMLSLLLNIPLRTVNITPYLKKFGIYKLLPGKYLPRFLKKKIVKKFYQVYGREAGESVFASSLDGLKGKKHTKWLARSNAYYRIKHRIRMVVLYLMAELENRLVAGAANKTEFLIGFFVKHGGDDASDIMPIMSLYKTQVRQLAHSLGVPEEIIQKEPSPDIIPGITDEFALDVSYEELDLILLGLDKHLTHQEICWQTESDIETVKYVEKLKSRSAHMREVFVPEI